MQKILCAWIGKTDLLAPEATKTQPSEIGPILAAIETLSPNRVYLLNNYTEEPTAKYMDWLRQRTKITIEVIYKKLSSPQAYAEVYQAARELLQQVTASKPENKELIFHLSPGTSAMTAVWIILAKTRFQATLVDSSKEHGVKVANVPFNIAAEFIPDLIRSESQALESYHSNDLSSVLGDDFVFASKQMNQVLEKAKIAAIYEFPILILGETGTGKEVLARAVHRLSLRKDHRFEAINCGAIPEGLIESELFGHVKGAFTGANTDRAGLFETAEKGTVFLDEIAELPLLSQTRLLRVLQEKRLRKVGSDKEVPCNVRMIAATHHNLLQEVADKKFREDLFYRLSVLVLQIPPLRERPDDIVALTDRFMTDLNQQVQTSGVEKKLSNAAKSVLRKHVWPGNIRELKGTLARAFVWSKSALIQEDDVTTALFKSASHREILNRDLSEEFKLESVLAEVAQHYLQRAVVASQGNKAKATKLLGLNNYQTLNYWLEKYNISWE